LPHIFGRPSGYGASADELVHRLTNRSLDVRATAQSLLELPFLIQGTPLVATIPERLAKLLAPVLPLKVLALPFELTLSKELVIWHKRNEPDPGHAWLRDVFISVAREV
jgi:DNA-binding transcriptional LysR family regulator